MMLHETAASLVTKLEYPVCPLCGSAQREFPFQLREPFTVARCAECGLHYLHPRLGETAIREAYQQSSYYEGGVCGYADTSYADQEAALRSTFKCLLNNLSKRGLTRGNLLEVGCGYGYLLDEAAPYFDRRVGTDYSPEAVAKARATGAEVFVGGVEQVPFEDRFDCTVAIQVIEHVYEPLSFVGKL